MSGMLFALALLAQDPAASAASPSTGPEPAPAAQELPWPPGAPRDDYGLVAFCHGALTGYLELHDRVMPEVTRIETTWRAPGRSLAEDMKIYADIDKQGRKDLKLFERAIDAAEKASPRPLAPIGAAAIQRGRATWAGAASLSDARIAQEWMSWSLPVRCGPTAQRLEKNAKLMGAAFDPTAEVAITTDAPGN
ncbi:hypothetical protein [Phenylobacterium koreense]|uniref:Uncharacterized protein n=1 Tax=Phenylobacterium koreense TaxID=266125 RepID=A0ABV2EEC1_9CAUL